MKRAPIQWKPRRFPKLPTTRNPMQTETIEDVYPTRQKDTFEVLERVDPVVYGTGPLPDSISQEQVDFYSENGFVTLDSLFSQEEAQAFRDELDGLRANETVREMPEAILEPDNNELRSLFRAHEISEIFAGMARDPRLRCVAEYLLGDRVYIHQSRVNLKPPFRGRGFYWHSDFETWHAEDGMPRMRAVSVSVALTENTVYNGSLMLIPGSHKQFVTGVGETPEENYKSSLRSQYIGVPDDASLQLLYGAGGIQMPVGPPGSATFFECNTMHGSGENISPLARSNVFFVYNAMCNQVVEPFGIRSPRPNFIATRHSISALE